MGYVQAEVNKLIQSGFTPIQFGISDNFTPLNGCIHIVDAPLEETAALYKAIGNYFGTDTGDLHLMVAVGGTCVVLVPEQIHPSYNPDDFCHVSHRIRRHVVPQVYCKFR